MGGEWHRWICKREDKFQRKEEMLFTLSLENMPPTNKKAYAKICSTNLLRL